MKFIKLFSIVSLTFLLSINNANSNSNIDNLLLTQLNSVMKSKLNLTDNQVSITSKLNRDYWTRKKSILRSSNMIGQNTALLECWDNWMRNLSKYLTKEQMNIFLEWQSTVDLLSEQII